MATTEAEFMQNSPAFMGTIKSIRCVFQEAEKSIYQIAYCFHAQVLSKDAEIDRLKNDRKTLYKDYCELQDEVVRLKRRNELLERKFSPPPAPRPSSPSMVVVKTEIPDDSYDNDSTQEDAFRVSLNEMPPESSVEPAQRIEATPAEPGSIHSAILQEIERNFPPQKQEYDAFMQCKVESTSDEDVNDEDVFGALSSSQVEPPRSPPRKKRRNSPPEIKEEPDDDLEIIEKDLPHLRAVLNGSEPRRSPANLGVASSLLSALASQREGECSNNSRPMSALRAALLEPLAQPPRPKTDCTILKSLVSSPPQVTLQPGSRELSAQRTSTVRSNTERVVELAIFKNLLDLPAENASAPSAEAPASTALRSVLKQYITDKRTNGGT